MSTHLVPDATAERLVRLCEQFLRPAQLGAADGRLELTFDPDLTPTEQARFDRLAMLAGGRLTLDPAELEALLPTLNGLRDYHALAAPTGAQTVAAVKGLIRVARAILRDSQ
jgi:hypothetical protein